MAPTGPLLDLGGWIPDSERATADYGVQPRRVVDRPQTVAPTWPPS